jgi:hypothetical protein
MAKPPELGRTTGLLALPPFTVTVAPGWLSIGLRVRLVALNGTVAV